MLTLRIWYYIVGALSIRVTGEQLEQFTNSVMLRGVVMWDIHREGNTLLAKVGVGSFTQIWPLARRAGCRLRIVDKQGLPFLWRTLKRRPAVMAALIMVILTLAVLSRFIWFVEVSGAEPVHERSILHMATEAGLQTGIPKSRVNTKAIERHLLLRMPDIVWVTVRLQGIRAVIEVAERQDSWDIDVNAAGNIVARKHGIVTKVLVLAGEALVAEGDTVVADQVLIQAPVTNGEPMQARGEIMARTWYQAYCEVPLVQSRLYPTGRIHVRETLIWGEHELVWKGRQEVPFREYETYSSQRTLEFWRNIAAPVELITHTYREVEWVEFELSLEEAQTEAVENARAAVMGRLSRGTPAGELVLEIIEGSDAIGAKATVDAIEEIGILQPLGVEMSVRSGAEAPRQ